MRDVLKGLRLLRRHPSFAVVAILSLALSIGANTTVFSVLDSVLLKPLPYPDSDRLVVVRTIAGEGATQVRTSSIAAYFAIRDEIRSFDAVGAFNGGACGVKSLGAIGEGTVPERLYGQCFSPSLFRILGTRPHLGRTFTDAEDQVGNVAPVALISHGLWQRRFEGRGDVVGQTFPLDGVQMTIVGVLPRDFTLFRDPNAQRSRPTALDFVIPLELPSVPSRLGGSTIVARLKPGVSAAQAQAEVAALLTKLGKDNPDLFAGFQPRIVSLREAAFNNYQSPVVLLQAVVVCVLLIGCANVAGLLIARHRSRTAEMAVRLALGGQRSRLVRQLIAETLPLSVIGGALGVLLAWIGLRAVSTIAPAHFSQLGNVSLDLRTLAFTTGAVLLTTLLFATLPAIGALRVSLVEALKAGGRGAVGPNRHATRRILVAGQVSLAMVLLVGSGLLVTSLLKAVRADLGADPANLVTFSFHAPRRGTARPLSPPQSYRGVALVEINNRPAQTVRRVIERVQNIPGVTAVAGASNPPLGGIAVPMPFVIAGAEPVRQPGNVFGRDTSGWQATYVAVAGDYFDVMKIPLIEGRVFDTRDNGGGAPVVIVNQTLARRFFSNRTAIGQRLSLDIIPDEVPREIVGVVGDTAVSPLEREREPTIYVPDRQQSSIWPAQGWGFRSGLFVVARTSESLSTFAPALTAAVAEIDATTPVVELTTVTQAVNSQLQDLRLAVLLLAVIAVVAATLAASGIYGVIAQTVADRTREIALRMVVGAGARQVAAMVTAEVGWVVGAGLLAGLALAVASSRLLQSVLFGITPTDPPTYTTVSLLFAAIAVIACLVPTWRAIAIDPTVALRTD